MASLESQAIVPATNFPTDLQSEDLAHCPLCLTPGQVTDTSCHGCGVSFEENLVVCAQCYQPVEAEAAVCPMCTAPLQGP